MLAAALLAFSPSSGDPVVAGASPEADPYVEAAATDERVEVVAERSETDTVYANPDGTTTREISTVPIRALSVSGWKDVDTTLDVADDGTVQPKVSTTRVELSNGGTAPLIVSEVGGVETALSWPSALPTPSLQGSTATYAEVFTGVDLRVTVTDVGTTTVLVVKTPQAATNPALLDIEMPIEVEGGDLVQGDGGQLSIQDGSGNEIAAAGQPVMWDSSGTVYDGDGEVAENDSPEAIAERSVAPAPGDSIEKVETTVTADAITLEPDASALAGPDVEYPVYVDPTISKAGLSRHMISSAFPSSSFHNWSGVSEGVGYQDWEPTPTRKRLFWGFGVPEISHGTGAVVKEAEFKVERTFSASCQAAKLQVYDMDAYSTSTTWNNQPTWFAARLQDTVTDAAGFSSACSPGDRMLEWDVTAAAERLAASTAPVRTRIFIGVKNESETNPNHWRRLKPNGRLIVTYGRAPGFPTRNSLAAPERTCNDSRPIGNVVPRLRAVLTDPESADLVRGHWEVYRGSSISGGTRIMNRVGGYAAEDQFFKTPVSWDLNLDTDSSGNLIGRTYTWRVRAEDNSGMGAGGANLFGPWSVACSFTVLPSQPLEPSIDFGDPEPTWFFGDEASTHAGTISYDGNPANFEKFRWSVNNPNWTHTITPTTGTSAQIDVAASQLEENILRVWAVNPAGTQSPVAEYRFFAEPLNGMVRYRLNDTGQPSAAKPEPKSPTESWPLTYDLPVDPAQWTVRGPANLGSDNFSLSFDGTNQTSTDAQVLTTDASFVVSAWLDADAVVAGQRRMMAVSHDAVGDRPAFWIGTQNDCQFTATTATPDCYSFGVWDSQTASWKVAHAGLEVVDGTFVHVVGQFKASTKELVVDADPAGPWNENRNTATLSAGSSPIATDSGDRLVVGGGRNASGNISTWVGRIEDVFIAQGIVGHDQLQSLHDEEGFQCYGTGCAA